MDERSGRGRRVSFLSWIEKIQNEFFMNIDVYNQYKEVDWDFPDAEIARRVGRTRERARQVRKALNLPRPRLFGVHIKSLDRKNEFLKVWNSEMSIREAAKILGVSYSNACRLIGDYGLRERKKS